MTVASGIDRAHVSAGVVELIVLRHIPRTHDRRACPLPGGERATLFSNKAEWVRGFGSISATGNPLTPALSPNGEREHTEIAVSSCTAYARLYATCSSRRSL